MSRAPLALLGLLPLLLAPPQASGQTLAVQAQVGSVVTALPAGAGLSMTSDGFGQAVTAMVTVRNTGASAVVINAVTLTDSSQFSLSVPSTLPVTLGQFGAMTFSVTFSAASAVSATTQVQIVYSVLGNSSVQTFTAFGSVPNLSLSYFFQPNGALQGLANNTHIVFGPVNVGGQMSATIIIANQGSGSGVFQSYSMGGDTDFQLLPTGTPSTIMAGGELRLTLQVRPSKQGTLSGSLSLRFGSSTVVLVTMEAVGAAAQYQVSYTVAPSNNQFVVANGGTVQFPPISASGSSLATVRIANSGNGSGSVKNIVLTGSVFELRNLPVLPATLGANTGLSVGLAFTPKQPGTYTGTLRVDLDSGSQSFQVAGSTAQAELKISYQDQSGNTVSVPEGGVIGATNVGAGSILNVPVSLNNTGLGSGIVNSITVTGAKEFQLAQLPIFPFTLNASSQLPFLVRFSPTTIGTYKTQLQLVTDSQTLNANIEATATGATFTYGIVTTGTTTTVLPNDTINFDPTDVGTTGKIVFQVRNTGTADGTIAGLLVSGTGFGVTDAPLPPIVVKQGGSAQFTISFSPTQPGDASGRMRVGDDTFNLKGVGTGTQLTYSYSTQGSTTALLPGGIVVFPTVAVGDSATVQIQAKNTGNKTLPVFGISLLAATTVFQMQGVAPVPFNLDPGATLSFTIQFAPNDVGPISAGFRVNDVGFNISGIGASPAKLPQYSFGGASGVQSPLQQPAVQLNLNDPYPLPLQGTLTLQFSSDVFADNPAVQFAAGGRKVTFRIPAGSTQAVFDNGANSVRVQTGTVAGNIILLPAFATEAGLDVTPANAATSTMTVNRSAPVLLQVAIVSRTLTAFQVVVTGYSTTRSLSQAAITMAPRGDVVLTGSSLTVPLPAASLAWYSSTQSLPYGGLFTFAFPVYLQGGDSGTDLAGQIASIAVTVANEVGTSNAISTQMP
jgi:hypothetical protein